jgi:hypothetical protein
MTTMQQLVVGVFRDHAQAEQAINELQQAGFDNHQIRFAGHGISTGGILEKIKSVFTGQDMSVGEIYDDLVNMGTPPEDARYYQNEFEAGHSIVAVQGTGVPLVAKNILARYGGYGANQRLTQSPDYDQDTGTPEPTSEDVYTEPRRPDQRPDYDKGTGVPEQAPEDIDTEPRSPEQRPAQSPTYNEVLQEPTAEDIYTTQPHRADQRPAQSPNYNEGTGIPEPTAEDIYTTQPRRPDQRPAQPPNYNKGAQEPASEDVNAEPRRSMFE